MGHLRAILFGDMPMPRARMPHGLCATLAFVARSSPSRYWQEFFLLAAFERGILFLPGQSLQGLESGSHASRTMTMFRPWNFCLLNIRVGALAQVLAEFIDVKRAAGPA